MKQEKGKNTIHENHASYRTIKYTEAHFESIQMSCSQRLLVMERMMSDALLLFRRQRQE